MTTIPLVILPDPADPECGEILVEGALGGRPSWFRLDTGAARSELIADESIALQAGTGRPAPAGPFGSVPGADILGVDGLVIGGLPLPPFDAVRVAAGGGRQNRLGMDVLRNYCCAFSFGTAELGLTGSPAAGADLALRLDDDDRPCPQLDWPGARAAASWDTGAGITVVDTAFAGRHPDLFSPDGVSLNTDSTGAQLSTPTFRMAGPAIGGAQFAASKVAIVDLSPVNQGMSEPVDLILGYPLLSQASWLFDFPARRWAVPQLISG